MGKSKKSIRKFTTTIGEVTLVKIKDGKPFDLFTSNKKTVAKNFEKLITDYGNKLVIGQFVDQRYFNVKWASEKEHSFSFLQQAHHGNWVEQVIAGISESLYNEKYSAFCDLDKVDSVKKSYDELAAHLSVYCDEDIWFPCFISAENNMIMLPCVERTPFGKIENYDIAKVDETTSFLYSFFSVYSSLNNALLSKVDGKLCITGDKSFYKAHCCLHNWDMVVKSVIEKSTNVFDVVGYAPLQQILKGYDSEFIPRCSWKSICYDAGSPLADTISDPLIHADGQKRIRTDPVYFLPVSGWLYNSVRDIEYFYEFLRKAKQGMFERVPTPIYNTLFACMRNQCTYATYLRNDFSKDFGHCVGADETAYHAESMDNKESNELANVDKFLSDMTLNAFYKNMKEHVIGHDDELKRACYYVYSYLSAISNGECGPRNFFITGKSGNGKTEFIRALKAVFGKMDIGIPILTIDTTSLTGTGWKGGDLGDTIAPFYRNNPQGFGILVFDEMDKKMVNTFIDREIAAFNGELQNNLLTALDGEGISVDKGAVVYPTKNTLIIGLGAFSSIRKQMLVETTSKIGFALHSEQDEYALDITVDTLIKYGAKEELAGRIYDVINFKSLSDKNIKAIIRSKIQRDVTALASIPVRNITFSKSAERKLVEYGKSDTGIRRAIGEIKKIVADCVTASMDMSKTIDIHVIGFEPLQVKTTTVRKTRSVDMANETEVGAKTRERVEQMIM